MGDRLGIPGVAGLLHPVNGLAHLVRRKAYLFAAATNDSMEGRSHCTVVHYCSGKGPNTMYCMAFVVVMLLACVNNDDEY